MRFRYITAMLVTVSLAKLLVHNFITSWDFRSGFLYLPIPPSPPPFQSPSIIYGLDFSQFLSSSHLVSPNNNHSECKHLRFQGKSLLIYIFANETICFNCENEAKMSPLVHITTFKCFHFIHGSPNTLHSTIISNYM